MPFFVAVDQEHSPRSLNRALATIQADFATSRALHPGRRHTRVFQRLDRPSHLLTIGEWEHQADFERLRRTPRYQEVVFRADPPGRIEILTRLRFFARMSTRPTIVACVMMSVPEHAADAVRAYLLREAHQQILQAPGLLSHEVYQLGGRPASLLAVHGWRALADLERFRAEDGPGFGAALAELGVTVTRFTGAVAAQFSRLEEQNGLAGRHRSAAPSPNGDLLSTFR
jgi:quinol monooxygenase YgiN